MWGDGGQHVHGPDNGLSSSRLSFVFSPWVVVLRLVLHHLNMAAGMKMSFVFSFFGLFQLSKDNRADVQPEIRRLDYIFMSLALSACIVLCAWPQESLHLSNTQSCYLHLFSTTLIPPCCIISPTSAPLLPSSFPPSLHYLLLTFLTQRVLALFVIQHAAFLPPLLCFCSAFCCCFWVVLFALTAV